MPALKNHLARFMAPWRASRVAASTVAYALVIHETAYLLTSPREYPFAVFANEQTMVFGLSHGGLDVLGAGVLIVLMLTLAEWAKGRRS